MKKEEVMEQLNAFIDEKKQKLQEIIKIFFDIKYLRIYPHLTVLLASLTFPHPFSHFPCHALTTSYIHASIPWLFYRKNIEAIREHLKHEDNGLFPTRNGGIGEIEFIRKNKIFEGCFVIYHSITSIL